MAKNRGREPRYGPALKLGGGPRGLSGSIAWAHAKRNHLSRHGLRQHHQVLRLGNHRSKRVPKRAAHHLQTGTKERPKRRQTALTLHPSRRPCVLSVFVWPSVACFLGRCLRPVWLLFGWPAAPCAYHLPPPAAPVPCAEACRRSTVTVARLPYPLAPGR